MEEKLLIKGFKLNTYSEGKYYEYITNDNNVIEKLVDELFGDEEILVLQCDENFENCKMCIDTNIWDLEQNEFIQLVEEL